MTFLMTVIDNRSTQIRMLRDFYLNNKHPDSQLLRNVLVKDKHQV